MKNKIIYFIALGVWITTWASAQVEKREHYIDQSTFHSTLSGILDGNVMGYQYSVGDESGVLFGDAAGLTRTAADNGGVDAQWTNNSKMITASVSKIVCAVAILHMLENVSVPGAPTIDDKLDLLLKDYIPSRWTSLIDGNEDQITLRHCLNHHTGLTGDIWNTRPKNALSGTMNVALPDGFDYENVNYDLAGFMTIYLFYAGEIAQLEIDLEDASTAVYDQTMINFIRDKYYNYVQNNIFIPIGITTETARLQDTTNLEVLGYDSPNDVSGASNFDIIITSMSNGWILSTSDLINFTQRWSNPHLPGNLLTTESVELINEFPVDAQSTPLGWNLDLDQYANNIEGYTHNGIWWRRNCPTCDAYTSALTISEDNVYMAILTNSRSTIPNAFSQHIFLRSAYNDAVCASDIDVGNSTVRKYNSAAQTIHSSTAQVDNGEVVVFKAGSSIVLEPGFEAKSGSLFKGYIDTCDNMPTENP